jgi:His-Xaa-Ser system protein HxsD
MEWFLSQVVDWNKFELLIDTKIFSKNIALKAAYSFLDKGYFFFKLDDKDNIILQFTSRDWKIEDSEGIIADFADELLSAYLRDNLEVENKWIREKIVWAAIANSLDADNFVQLDTDNVWWDGPDNSGWNQIDFDKDIDEILKEIENDPELKIDEQEIENILKEIEEESATEETKSGTEETKEPAVKEPLVNVNLDWVKKAKDGFKNTAKQTEWNKNSGEKQQDNNTSPMQVDLEWVKRAKENFKNMSWSNDDGWSQELDKMLQEIEGAASAELKIGEEEINSILGEGEETKKKKTTKPKSKK